MNKKRRLNREQERQRLQGLRLLARIIARHYLEHPDLYPAPGGDGVPGVAGGVRGDGGVWEIGENVPTVNAAERDGGNAARKEANQ